MTVVFLVGMPVAAMAAVVCLVGGVAIAAEYLRV